MTYFPLFTSKLWKKFLSLSSPSAVSATLLLGVPRGVEVRTMVVLDASGEILGAGDSISDDGYGEKFSGPGVDATLDGVASRSFY